MVKYNKAEANMINMAIEVLYTTKKDKQTARNMSKQDENFRNALIAQMSKIYEAINFIFMDDPNKRNKVKYSSMFYHPQMGRHFLAFSKKKARSPKGSNNIPASTHTPHYKKRRTNS